MRYALVTLLMLTPALATVAYAQEGAGHGPPKTPTTVPIPTVPTTSVPTSGGSLSSLFQPKGELGAMMK
jgi:hypothetical protein